MSNVLISIFYPSFLSLLFFIFRIIYQFVLYVNIYY
nr:MAG TPA: hypothetical protein [Caudoviricetes sp.]